ncbi:restriction endonuclease [Hymenobacter qilianensis]|uniref:Restriction endonuclease n=2 Tax=Hymenobacter qilianensis TaxID=1385715 RepID=A0ACB5PR71_9BACT|nr:HsdR family type I site-specific deoxyribonuclease [Hymenobacter qilianensis]QNP52068.1 HsdR family type I site-specific deoxyribonuclease [Hymenobacter qilianensis]GGF64270.1 restriction endonuclease [Hymenobacter qilianensis]
MKIGDKERATQNRVVKLLRDLPGYTYLGNWEDKPRTSPIEDELLRNYLKRQGYSEVLVTGALQKLHQAADNLTVSLYERNKAVYQLLRYGIPVKPEAGKPDVTVKLVRWEAPLENDYGVAEEVTVTAGPGAHGKRPDVVLYLNGIAVGVLELKRSTVSVHEGIRQNLDNQKKLFIEPFFATMQLVMAGSDTEGLRYGTTGTEATYYLEWLEEGEEPAHNLDKHLTQLCSRERLLSLLHDFVIFDRGIKKLCRPNQYFGVLAAREYAKRKEGGVIWHTQGSGKSLTMVWLTKWLLETRPQARVLLLTDRDELDEQIEKVFKGVNETIYRTKNGKDLLTQLHKAEPRLLCSLIHKFGRRKDEAGYEEYLRELAEGLGSREFKAKGEIWVLVDECHRTQSGKLHEALKKLLGEGTTLLGFTGTPLLKTDKRSTLETFGPFIHTYKMDAAVRDGVVLELRYEARDIEQYIGSPKKIDAWFEAKTAGLNDYTRTALKKKWGTMQQVLSSKGRLEVIVKDIIEDMTLKPRLHSGRGNAMLVAGSIYEACKYYELFVSNGFTKCAIVTSYEPHISHAKGQGLGTGAATAELQQYETYQKMLGKESTEDFEIRVKKLFVDEPAQMKLLIVVDKLLTGFDAPSASYLYIDKKMRDHGLFQAICRVNRLDGEDKEYGYVVDYKDLFETLKDAINDYTQGAFDEYDKKDVEGLLNNRLDAGRKRLEEVREQLRILCEPAGTNPTQEQYIAYFCGNPAKAEDLKNTEGRRRDLYKYTTSLLHAYVDLAAELPAAGYTEAEATQVKYEVNHYEQLRETVKIASGEAPDLKAYEPDMRQLLDMYVKAEDSEQLGDLDDLGLIEMIVRYGADEATKGLPKKMRASKEAMAETIANNVRRLIIQESATDPKYYETMSQLLEALVEERRLGAAAYEEYLAKITELCRKMKAKESATGPAYPTSLDTPGKKALYNQLENNEELALAADEAIQYVKKDNWIGNRGKEIEVRNAVVACGLDKEAAEKLLEVVRLHREYK